MTENLYIPLPQRAVLLVSGDDRLTFLQGIISNDVTKISEHQAIYALMLTPQGKFLYDFFIAWQEDALLLDYPFQHKEAIIKKLGMYKLRSNVAITQADNYEVVALYGQDVYKEMPNQTAGSAKPFCKGVAYLDPRINAPLARSFIERENAYQAFKSHDFGLGEPSHYETQRLSLALPKCDADLISGESFPHDFALDALNAIDYTKGCYVGQEVTARMHHRGTKKKTLYKVHSDSVLPPQGTKLTNDVGKSAGVMCSSFNNIGLALVNLQADGTVPAKLHSDECVMTVD